MEPGVPVPCPAGTPCTGTPSTLCHPIPFPGDLVPMGTSLSFAPRSRRWTRSLQSTEPLTPCWEGATHPVWAWLGKEMPKYSLCVPKCPLETLALTLTWRDRLQKAVPLLWSSKFRPPSMATAEILHYKPLSLHGMDRSRGQSPPPCHRHLEKQSPSCWSCPQTFIPSPCSGQSHPHTAGYAYPHAMSPLCCRTECPCVMIQPKCLCSRSIPENPATRTQQAGMLCLGTAGTPSCCPGWWQKDHVLWTHQRYPLGEINST